MTLPKLSLLKKSGRLVEGNSYLNQSMQLSLVFAVPASVGLIYLNSEIISSLFQRGNFSVDDSVQTSRALAIYGLSVIPISLQLLLLNFYFAEKNIRIPFYYSLASVFLNVSFSYSLLGVYGFLAPPIAYAITNWFVLVSLLYHTHKFGFYFNSTFKRALPRIILSSCVMFFLLVFLKSTTIKYFSDQNLSILWLGTVILISGISYFACLKILGILNKNYWANDFNK